MHFKELLEAVTSPVDYDIKKRYNFFNKKLFNNMLSNGFPMKFRRTKQTGGAVVHNTKYIGKGNRKRVTSYEVKELYLSTFYLKTKDQLDQILVHEMIHIWMMQEGYHEGFNVKLHGAEFVSKVHELQSKVKFQIPMIDNLSDTIRDHQNKTYGVVISKSKLGNSIAVFSEAGMKKNITELIELLSINGTVGSDYHVGYCTAPELESFKIKRTINSIEFFYLKPEVQASLDATFTLEIMVKGGEKKPMMRKIK